MDREISEQKLQEHLKRFLCASSKTTHAKTHQRQLKCAESDISAYLVQQLELQDSLEEIEALQGRIAKNEKNVNVASKRPSKSETSISSHVSKQYIALEETKVNDLI